MAVNMSYCRWQNTLEALRECYESIPDSGGLGEVLSGEELEAAKKVVGLCGHMAAELAGELS